MTISNKDRKLLWGMSAGKCNVCKIDLSLPNKDGTIGEEAHTVSGKENGPRADKNFSRDKIDHYKNLILLCPNHHTEIDKNPGDWPAEKLRNLKTVHEKWVKDSVSADSITEIEGQFHVSSSGGVETMGLDIQKPTRIKPGTQVSVKTKNTKRTIGVRVGGEK